MNVTIRDRINSVAGEMDEAHGRPFVLGRAMRLKARIVETYYRDGFPGRQDHGTIRLWLACIQLPNGTWRDDYAFTDEEVFRPCP